MCRDADDRDRLFNAKAYDTYDMAILGQALSGRRYDVIVVRPKQCFTPHDLLVMAQYIADNVTT